jgi:hypothetical protein
MAINWYDPAVTAVGALLNGGTLKLYAATEPAEDGSITQTLLVTLTFSATAFGSSSGGTATANSITSGTAVATGTASFFAMCESGGSVVGTGVVGTSGADLNLNTTSIVTGAPVSVSSFTLPG